MKMAIRHITTHFVVEGHISVISLLTIEGKFSVMTETLLYGLGSCERHAKLAEEMHIPVGPTPNEVTLRR